MERKQAFITFPIRSDHLLNQININLKMVMKHVSLGRYISSKQQKC